MASRYGHYEIIKLLLDNGAKCYNNDVTEEIWNTTPLHLAIDEGHYDVFILLLEYGGYAEVENSVRLST